GYEKAKAEHLRLSRKIMNIRNNHIHQATAKLVKTKPMRIVVEDLSISNLLKNKKLASSKICSCCGVKYDHSVQPEGQWSLKIREWCCVSCNSHHDRDVNAAINLSRWVK
ncbi:zinc ribbon domain-containing protein, partial [Bacillus albus]